ncbi:MAG: threonine synthase [Bacteroidales bacterium]
MQYYSTGRQTGPVSLKEAVTKGLAADGGLYMPVSLPEFPASFFELAANMSLQEISFEVASAYLKDDVPVNTLSDIISSSLNFPIPLTEVEPGIYSLELYHGPTMAFKDVGARFMSRLLAYLHRGGDRSLNVIVATSGDTGSAVAAGFFNVPGINVFVFFPKGKVSPLQQKQITTWGGNIYAVEVDGSFDDCQKLAKQMLGDSQLNSSLLLTSANSINIARLIPQSFYYYYARARLSGRHLPTVFSVPSGNFGNLTGGLMAKATGLPVHQFIAATNINDVFREYLTTGVYRSRPSRQTISNAMDVGDPSNFARIMDLMGSDIGNFRKNIVSYSYTDEETSDSIKEVYSETGYIMDPHGAVAYRGLKQYLSVYREEVSAVFLETAHPAKFPETMMNIVPPGNELPAQLQGVINKEEKYHQAGNDLEEIKAYIMQINS